MSWEKGLIRRAGPDGYTVVLPWAGGLLWQMHSAIDAKTTARFGDAVYVTIATVTPARAELMLQNAMPNRPIKRGGVEKLARDLRNDRWLFNGVPMLFDRTGRLGDGRHRATAGVRTMCSFSSLLVVGVDGDAIQRTVDAGIVRSVSDRLAIKEHKYASTLAATCRLIQSYLADDHAFRTIVSDQEIEDLVDADPRIGKMVIATKQEKGWTGFLPPSVVSFLRWILTDIDSEDCEDFLTKLRTGIGILDEKDPIGLLRRQIDNKRRIKQFVGTKDLIPLCLKVWNLFREGEGRVYLKPPDSLPVPR